MYKIIHLVFKKSSGHRIFSKSLFWLGQYSIIILNGNYKYVKRLKDNFQRYI